MMLEVNVQHAVDAPELPDAAQLDAWAKAAWRQADGRSEVVVRICDEDESRQLNHEYRDKEGPTNVLSFSYEPLPEIELYHIGDLVICAPVVVREAEEQGKTPSAHWAHMVVHGMLHLQGFDHETDEEAMEMESLESEILTALGFPAPYATDEMS